MFQILRVKRIFNFIFFLGEAGKAVIMDLNTEEVRQANMDYGFNTVASDMISLNRTIPDVRMEEFV